MKIKILQKKWFQYLINIVAIVAIYFILTILFNKEILNGYWKNTIIIVGISIIMTVSLNLATGFLGQLPLGHAGFMSVGAYSSSLFTLNFNFSPEFIAQVTQPVADTLEMILALLIGGCVAAIFGIIIGLPALRLNGDYLAIITLGFGEIIRVIIENLKITKGAMGLNGMKQYSKFPLVYICVVITIFVVYALIKSRHGRAILSIRENEIAAEASGISTTYYKTLAFTVSAFFAGIAGVLYAHHIRSLAAANFGFLKSVDYLVMVVLGGMGSIVGSVVAATGLTIIPELLREFEEYRLVVYALLLVVVMIFKPSGLFGRYDFSFSKSIDNVCSSIRKLLFGKNYLKKENKNGGKK